MSWLYGQTWLWYLIAFLVGLALAWLVFVRPQQRRLAALRSRSPAPAGASPAGAAGAVGAAAAVGGAAVGLSKSAPPTTTETATAIDEPTAETTTAFTGARAAPPGSDEPTETGVSAPLATGLDEPTDSTRITTPVPDEPTEALPRPAAALDEPTETLTHPGGAHPVEAPDPPTESIPVVAPADPRVEPAADDPTDVFPAVDPALSTLDTASLAAADAETPPEGLAAVPTRDTAATVPDDPIPDHPIPDEPIPDRPAAESIEAADEDAPTTARLQREERVADPTSDAGATGPVSRPPSASPPPAT